MLARAFACFGLIPGSLTLAGRPLTRATALVYCLGVGRTKFKRARSDNIATVVVGDNNTGSVAKARKKSNVPTLSVLRAALLRRGLPVYGSQSALLARVAAVSTTRVGGKKKKTGRATGKAPAAKKPAAKKPVTTKKAAPAAKKPGAAKKPVAKGVAGKRAAAAAAAAVRYRKRQADDSDSSSSSSSSSSSDSDRGSASGGGRASGGGGAATSLSRPTTARRRQRLRRKCAPLFPSDLFADTSSRTPPTSDGEDDNLPPMRRR